MSSKNDQTEEIFRCRPAKQGLFVYRPGTEDEVQGFFVPPRADDEVLKQPDLTFELSRDDVQAIGHPDRPFAMTWFGPPDKDKASNQDFAVSAIVRDDRHQPWAVAAVADGVSTKTFWPERAARIACLVAFEVLRRWIGRGDLKGVGQVRKEELKFLKKVAADLTRTLHKAFDLDRRELCRRDAHGLVPPHFAPDLYEEHRHEDRWWYNTTLQVAALGPDGGVLLHVGDGGICMHRPPNSVNNLVKSGGETSLQRYAGFGVREEDFEIFRIGPGRLRLLMATDGLDRTLQLQQRTYGDLLAEGSWESDPRPSGLTRATEAMFSSSKSKDRDNVSLACLDWPPVEKIYPQMEAVRVRLPASFEPPSQQPSKPSPEDVAASPEGADVETGESIAPAPPPVDHEQPSPADAGASSESETSDPATKENQPEAVTVETASSSTERSRRRPTRQEEDVEEPLKLPPADVPPAGKATKLKATGIIVAAFLAFAIMLFLFLRQDLSRGAPGEGGGRREASVVASERPPPTSADQQPSEDVQQQNAGNPRQAGEEVAHAPGTAVPVVPLEDRPTPQGAETPMLQHPRSREIASLILGYYRDLQDLIEQSKLDERLTKILMVWRDEMWNSTSKEFTIIAYADRARETVDHCDHNRGLAEHRATQVASWLQRFAGKEYVVHAETQVCQSPPDVLDPKDIIARRIVLVEGLLRMECDCAETFGTM